MIHLQKLIFLAGIFQIILAVASTAIPKLLNWKGGLLHTSPMIRQMFWTYAAYIFGINLFFGLISVFMADSLMGGSTLSFSVTFFIGIYWTGRIAIHFFYFDRKGFPKGRMYFLGELMLVLLFIFLAGVYLFASYHNYLIIKK